MGLQGLAGVPGRVLQGQRRGTGEEPFCDRDGAAVHRGLPALELGVLAPALGQLHGREPFGADQRHMAPRGAEQRLIHLEERRVDAQQRLVAAQLRLGPAQAAEVDVEQRAALAVPQQQVSVQAQQQAADQRGARGGGGRGAAVAEAAERGVLREGRPPLLQLEDFG